MYWQVIEIAEEALTGNLRHWPEAAGLEPRSVAITFEPHRREIPLFVGASDAPDEHQRTCVFCKHAIKNGDPRYRIGEAEYHPKCFKSWLNVPLLDRNEASR